MSQKKGHSGNGSEKGGKTRMEKDKGHMKQIHRSVSLFACAIILLWRETPEWELCSILKYVFGEEICDVFIYRFYRIRMN